MKKKITVALGFALIASPAFTTNPTQPNPFLPLNYIDDLRRRMSEDETHFKKEYLGEWPDICPECDLKRSECICKKYD